jgi:vacuolar iron transporter family protein
MSTIPQLEIYLAKHYIHRSNWLRAAVLGANDGILSTASIAIGVAAATHQREAVVLASLAGLVAGAFSMAAGEYVSVSSQTDLEKADIAREEVELREMPEMELRMLADIYEKRGLKPETALEVARQLTEHNALEAHVRDELGITELTQANPLQAAAASGGAFTAGGLLPMMVSLFVPLQQIVYWHYAAAILFLGLLGAIAARAGGSPVWPAIFRITFWGTIAMVMTALVGHLFGVQTG